MRAEYEVYYVNPLDRDFDGEVREEWLDTGWYYNSMGDAIGPFESSQEAQEAAEEDERF